jgi:hypothetical protein
VNLREVAAQPIFQSELSCITQLQNRKRRVANRALTDDENTIPYCSVFKGDVGFSFPTDFSIQDYQGLLFCYVSKDNRDAKIVADWRSENHYRVSADRFKRDLKWIDTEWAGAVVEVQRRREPFWKRNVTASILAIAALFGAISAIRD